MRRTIAAIIVAGALVSLPACGNNDANTDNGTSVTAESTTASSTKTTTVRSSSVTSTADLGMIDQAKLAAFVVAFRTAYPDLAQDREDESIQEIVFTSCNDIAAGVSEQDVTEEIRDLAANNDTEATQAQAEQIYKLVTPACP
jgi:hypothetical protein